MLFHQVVACAILYKNSNFNNNSKFLVYRNLYKNNALEISAPTWNHKFKLPNE